MVQAAQPARQAEDVLDADANSRGPALESQSSFTEVNTDPLYRSTTQASRKGADLLTDDDMAEEEKFD